MVKRRRKIGPLGTLVVGTVSSSLLGSAMPGTTGTALNNVASGLSGFVAPATSIYGAGLVMKQLRKFPKPRRIKRRKRR